MPTTFAQCAFTASDNTLLQDYVQNGSDSGCTFVHPTPTGYQPLAVHFDGNEILSTDPNNLTATAGSEGFMSLWFRPDVGFGNDYLMLQVDNTNTNYYAFVFVSNAGPPWSVGVGFQDTGDSNDFFCYYKTELATGWHHLLVAWNLAFASGSRLVTVYADDVQCPIVAGYPSETGDAIVVPYDIIPMWVCASNQDTPSTVGDLADVFVWYGTTIVQGDGTIAEVDRRRFIDKYHQPVDPSDALTFYGSPVAGFRGPVADFTTNIGTGGDFTLSGTGTLADATSPPWFADGIVLNNAVTVQDKSAIGAAYPIVYQVATATQADYSVQFDAVLAEPAGIVPDGSSLNAVLRADGDGNGYTVGLQVASGEFQLYVATDPANLTTVNAGVTSTPDSGTYTVVATVQGTTIAAALQRASDSKWLQSDATWGDSQVNAISITDSTFTAAGNLLIGGTWIGA